MSKPTEKQKMFLLSNLDMKAHEAKRILIGKIMYGHETYEELRARLELVTEVASHADPCMYPYPDYLESFFRKCDIHMNSALGLDRGDVHDNRLVGEYYYINRPSGPEKTELFKATIKLRLPLKADPIAAGWKPGYWQNEKLMLLLNEPMLYSSIHPYYKELSVRFHKRGVHYLGELLRAHQENAIPKEMRARELISRTGSLLWPTFIVPPNWKAPDWRMDERWERELSAQKSA